MSAITRLKQFLNLETKGAVRLPKRQASIFLSKIGAVNNYDENSRTYIEQGYQQNPAVYGIVSDVCKSFSRAKWCVRDKKTGEVFSHPVLDKLLISPSPGKSLKDFHQEAITHRMLQGNSFDVMEMANRDGLNSGLPQYLYTLPAEDIQIIPTSDRRGIAGYQVDSAWAEGSMIPATDVMHLRNPNPDFDEPDNFQFGQSDFRAAFRSIQAYNDSLETGVWFLQNKGAQKILFNENEEMELSLEATDELKNKLRQQTQGPKNAGNLPIYDGKLGALDISTNPGEILVLEQRDQAEREICGVVGYPPALRGLTDSTYQNAKEAKKAKWENIIIPLLDERQAGYNAWLSPKFGENVEIYYDVDHIDALQEDKLIAAKVMKENYAGVATVDEVREAIGLPLFNDARGQEMFVAFTQSGAGDDNKPKTKE